MRSYLATTVLAAAIAAGWTLPAQADKGGKHGGHQKWEYDDGNCKYEYKRTPGVTKEEVKCRGPQAPVIHHHAPPPVRFVQLPRAVPVPAPGVGFVHCNRDLIGGVLGGIAGGLIGSQFGKGDGNTAATIAGGVIGVLVGGSIGRAMDQADMACVGQALEYAPLQQPVVWNSPAAGADFMVTPLRAYEGEGGLFCREYQTRVVVGGRSEQAFGTACRMPDGDWRMMN